MLAFYCAGVSLSNLDLDTRYKAFAIGLYEYPNRLG